ncbi:MULTISPECIES: hypothetical protein [unclassified Pseudomonas]|uniref:hypothetical protein n=1 Tax=unclassified Pseudomonas TaxID=196821 RepID=UPI000C8789D6|nr:MULTISPECIES: hypothetical protein [unclassified Pseudomonas]PMU08620.1 hypothetical protein C1Y11_20815 [Pseudomonas sp. FW305-20]PMU19398.1 hypothetical protein C1Y10_09215 [Pseudomonas sp. FW305-122]PMU38513.1 hypothetical protein C1Y12_15995 [Pseudomonas sp. FW305-47B]PMX59386.1 hypothetical protein C1Y13_17475 [Pseudomonas sp. FW305-33]PMX69392.1 hypothetical protein C1X12_07560 [Pseudomonas sp. FW305-60]
MKNPTLSVADVAAALLNQKQAVTGIDFSAWSFNELESMHPATFIADVNSAVLDVGEGVASDPDAQRLLRGVLNVALVSHESLRLVVPDALLDTAEIVKICESTVQSVSEGEGLSDQPEVMSNTGQSETFSSDTAVQRAVLPGVGTLAASLDPHPMPEAMSMEVSAEDVQGVGGLSGATSASDQLLGSELMPGAQVELADSTALNVSVNVIANLSQGEVLESGGESVLMEVNDFLLLPGGSSEVSLELEDLIVDFSDPVGQVFTGVEGECVYQDVHVAAIEKEPLDSEGAKDVF